MAIHNDIVYRTTPQRELRLDLRVPDSSTPPPLVLYIPMGGMRGCAKENGQWWLTEYGFAMASIECRVSSEVTAPEPVYDCKAAIRWLRTHAGEYGYNGETIGAWGHSAGGLLAALMATSGDRPEVEGDGDHRGVSSRIQAACDACGAPHDFTWFARPDIKEKFAPVAENLRVYLGGAVEEKPELARLVSPQIYVSAACPPILLLHGDADDIVPVEETIEFHRVLQAAGVDSTLRVMPGVGHGWDAAVTRDDVVTFFNRTLKQKG